MSRRSAAERHRNNLKGFNAVCLENGSSQGQNLAYLCRILSTAVIWELELFSKMGEWLQFSTGSEYLYEM